MLRITRKLVSPPYVVTIFVAVLAPLPSATFLSKLL